MSGQERRLTKLENAQAQPYATLEEWLDYLDNPVGPPPVSNPEMAALLDSLAGIEPKEMK
jgi:hypothetical protein